MVTPKFVRKHVSEVRAVAVDFGAVLDSGELLTGTPTVTEATGGVTLGSKAVNTGSITVNGRTVITGQAVQFTITGGTAGTEYTVVVTCGTNATPAQTLIEVLRFKVIADTAQE